MCWAPRRGWPAPAALGRHRSGDAATTPVGHGGSHGEPGDELTISQWPLFIDPGKNGTVAEFERETGVDVNYIEDINDNAEFFGKLRPLLPRGSRAAAA